MKLTVHANLYGYTGIEVGEYLRQNGIECEFADPNFVVLMFTSAITEADVEKLTEVLSALPQRPPLSLCLPPFTSPERVMTVREALLSPAEVLPVEECIGRIAAAATVGCPPAVPIVVSGEIIDEGAVECFRYYGIDTCAVVRHL